MLPQAVAWIASQSPSSGAHLLDPLARNDGSIAKGGAEERRLWREILRCAIAHRSSPRLRRPGMTRQTPPLTLC
jgi:hypothetical protein